MLASDRRYAKDDTVLMTKLKTDWCRVQKLLGRSRDKACSLITDWIVVQRRPTYAITRQLTRWTQLSQLRLSDGSQRSIEGYFFRVPAPPKSARPATAASAIRAAPPSQTRPTSHAPDVPVRTATPVPPSRQGRPLDRTPRHLLGRAGALRSSWRQGHGGHLNSVGRAGEPLLPHGARRDVDVDISRHVGVADPSARRRRRPSDRDA